MKYWYLYCVLFLSQCSYSQINYYDSLKQYSYYIVGLKKINEEWKAQSLGTGFFVRNNNKLNFITARHVIADSDIIKKETRKYKFDTIGIYYYDYYKKDSEMSSLNIKEIKKYMKDDAFYESPDIVVMKIVDTFLIRSVKSLESYVFPKMKDGFIIDSIICIGYAEDGVYPIKYPSYLKSVLTNDIHPNNYPPPNDSLYYAISNKGKTGKGISPIAKPGMSGSPVFIICKNKNTEEVQILFGGIALAGNSIYGYTYILPPERVKDYFINEQ